MSLADRIAKENARLAKKEKDRSSFTKIDFFKPETGETMVRLLPGKDKKDDYQPFHTVNIHYITKELDNGKTVNIPARCLQDFGDDCPVCEAADKAMKMKNKELAKKLRPRETHLYSVLDYKAKQVLVWAAGAMAHTQIMQHAGDIVEIFDLEGGRDWKVVKGQRPGVKGPLGITYSVRPAPKDSDVPEKYSPLIEEAVDLKTVYAEKQVEDMEAFVEGLDFEDGVEEEVVDKSRFKKSVKSLKSRHDEDEEDDRDEDDEDEDDEDDIPENKLKSKAKAAAAAAKAKSKSRDDEEEEEDEDEEEEEKPRFKKSSKTREDEDEEDEKPKKKSKKADLDFDDEDLEKEMNSLLDEDDDE